MRPWVFRRPAFEALFYPRLSLRHVVLGISDVPPVDTRVTQVVAETVQAQGATVRTSQVISEVLLALPEESRVSQVVVEVLMPTIVESRVSQMVGELLDAGQRPVRVSQIVVELLGKTSSYCGPPSLSPAALCGKPDVLAWLEWTVPMREN